MPSYKFFGHDRFRLTLMHLADLQATGGVQAVGPARLYGHIAMLEAWMCHFHDDGDLSGIDDLRIEVGAGWCPPEIPLEWRGRLVHALRESGLIYVRDVASTQRTVWRGWDQNAPDHIRKRIARRYSTVESSEVYGEYEEGGEPGENGANGDERRTTAPSADNGGQRRQRRQRRQRQNRAEQSRAEQRGVEKRDVPPLSSVSVTKLRKSSDLRSERAKQKTNGECADSDLERGTGAADADAPPPPDPAQTYPTDGPLSDDNAPDGQNPNAGLAPFNADAPGGTSGGVKRATGTQTRFRENEKAEQLLFAQGGVTREEWPRLRSDIQAAHIVSTIGADQSFRVAIARLASRNAAVVPVLLQAFTKWVRRRHAIDNAGGWLRATLKSAGVEV